LEKHTDNLSVDVPIDALTIQRFLNAIKEPIRAAFKDRPFMVFGDVDRVSPWNGCYYLNLVEKAGSYTYSLKVFIPEQLALKNNLDIRSKMKLLVVGNVVLNKNEMQLNAMQCEDLGYSRLHKQIEEWKKIYKPLFERRKKVLPLLCRNIAIVSNRAIQGFEDFNKHLEYGELTVFETKMQGDKVSEDIAAAIKEIQASNKHDCIVIVRGGGSFTDLYEFNKPVLLEAIAASMIPVASAVGHETDFPLCDFAADIRFSTPTDAGKELTKRVETLKKDVLDWKQILINAAILKIKAIDGKLKQLSIQISDRGKSAIELALQEINKQREILNLTLIAQIDKGKQAVLNYKSTIYAAYINALRKNDQAIKIKGEQIRNSLRKAIDKQTQALQNFQSAIIKSYFNALQKYDQSIKFRSEQINNGLRKAQEKETIKSKHRKIILVAAIIIAVLIVIILVLLKS
jgi:exodeoxyribonuclease VII large subunit